MLMKQDNGDVWDKAARFVKNDVENEEEALQGARDIIAEWVSENDRARNTVRRSFDRMAVVKAKVVKGKEGRRGEVHGLFRLFRAFAEDSFPPDVSHSSGEAEGILKVAIEIPEEETIESLERIFVKGRNESAEQVTMAVKDGYKRLLLSSIETEYLQKR